MGIYASSCVLARCSKSLNEGVESAHHEEMMTKIWCEEAYTRIMNNLRAQGPRAPVPLQEHGGDLQKRVQQKWPRSGRSIGHVSPCPNPPTLLLPGKLFSCE